jgi:cytochrome P450
LESFIADLLLNPKVQTKIHEELDQEIPTGTTPSFSDRSHLPYLDAAWRESIRMHPATPLGLPHGALEEDVYDGMYIPKDTGVIVNIG